MVGAITPSVLSVGHGTLTADAFRQLVLAAGVERLIDVRSFPGSRRHPQFGREAMAAWLPAAGVEYRWLQDLGGRRRPVAGSKHVALRNESFRAYADHMETAAFLEAEEVLLALAGERPVAVMCSESLWWRCHRRLLADHLAAVHGAPVRHLMHDGRATEHRLTPGARVAGRGVVYDVGETPPLPSLSGAEDGTGGGPPT